MKEQDSIRNTEAVAAALPVGKLSPFLQLAQARGRRKIRIALPAVPPRQLCVVERKILAARRAVELAFWQASGGDFLCSSLAAKFIDLAKGLRLNAQP